ncbi:hypothetical protein ID866_7698 [Astraeus odoratus]|nr:hypothetical protein ID866_7698 [Astraeus odoratus]
METTFQALRDRPCIETIQRNVETAILTPRKRKCMCCIDDVAMGMQDFALVFKEKLNELIAKVNILHISTET